MGSGAPADLEAAFARYRLTQDALRGRANPDLAQIDAALAARVELYRCLVDSGWQPPDPVARQIDLDAMLMEQSRGAPGS